MVSRGRGLSGLEYGLVDTRTPYKSLRVASDAENVLAPPKLC